MNPSKPTRVGVLLRVGIFAFLEIAGMALLAPLMYPIGGYLVSAALSTFAAAAIANTVALRVFERAHLADVGLQWARASGRNLGLGLAGGAAAAALVCGVPLLLGHAEFRKAEGWEGSIASALFLSVVLLFGAIGEELLFRGYGFQVLLNKMGVYATILPVSILFGLAHSNNQNSNWLGMANTTLWGLLFGLAFLRSRDLWLPIGLHYGWNFTLPYFGVNLSGFTMNVTGYVLHWKIPERWSGGEYGPEAGLLTTFVLALLFYLLFKAPIERQAAFLYRPDEDEE
ncbi:MAG TPA: CPBP family intramembrane glutamic endopeptidase [Bryobacteraceae bacterium]|nr:CPBP family intramembrane glutamic endopeptidase [Bryobacteraceae bacterium]